MGARIKTAPLKYKWWKCGPERWELILMGNPDCYAYIIRYWSERYKDSAWCWTLTMPRGGRESARGWASAPHLAKRQVERAIQEHWVL